MIRKIYFHYLQTYLKVNIIIMNGKQVIQDAQYTQSL